MYYNSNASVKHRLSPNRPPSRWIAPRLTKRAVLCAYSWRLVSAASTQSVINRFRLWSA